MPSNLTHPSGHALQFVAPPNENSVGDVTPHFSSVPSPTQKYPVLQRRHLGFVVEFLAAMAKHWYHFLNSSPK